MNLKEIQAIETLDIETFIYMRNKLKEDLEIKIDFIERINSELSELRRIQNKRYQLLIPRHEESIEKEKIKINFIKDLIKDLDSKISFLKGWKDY